VKDADDATIPTPRRMGRRLKKLRTAKGMSQDALAKRAKITREYVNKLEAGRYDPTMTVLVRLARGLDVPVTELLNESGRRAARRRSRACCVDATRELEFPDVIHDAGPTNSACVW
jgi:transcriptional regulator with XRE-family HTH domain